MKKLITQSLLALSLLFASQNLLAAPSNTMQNLVKVNDQIEVMQFDGYSIHTFYGLANSHIIETPNSLYLVDAQFMRSQAEALRAYIEQLNKPLKQVIISHAHPDHWSGALVFEDIAPIVTSAAVKQELDEAGQQEVKDLQAGFGDEAPSKPVTFSNTINVGEYNWDGLQVEINEYLNHESASSITLKLPELGVFIGQDLFYNDTYLVANSREGNQNWIALLESFSAPEFVADYPYVLVGHGKNATPEIYGKIIAYLQQLETLLDKSLPQDEIRAAMKNAYSNYQSEFFLDLSMEKLFATVEMGRVVEVITFRLKDGTDVNEFLAANQIIRDEYVSQQPGFIGRQTGVTENGDWIISVYWESKADAQASIDGFSKAPGLEKFASLINFDTMVNTIYELQ